MTAGVDDEGQVVVSSYPQRAKVRNLRRDPAASASVLSDEWNGAWVQVDGGGEVVDLPEAVEALVDYFRSISGEHPDWDEYRQAMAEQGKCLIRLTPSGGAPSPPAASRRSSAGTDRSGAATTDEVEEPAELPVRVAAARFELDLEDEVLGVGPRGRASSRR